jgi:hypothetical protein
MEHAIFWTIDEVAARAEEIYQSQIRSQVETPENIGKKLVLDVETGEYAIDDVGIESAMKLKAKRPAARLFTFRIGFDVVASFGGQ